MELDCIIFNNPVKYESANDDGSYPISVRTEEGELFYLNKYGCLYDRFDSKSPSSQKEKNHMGRICSSMQVQMEIL